MIMHEPAAIRLRTNAEHHARHLEGVGHVGIYLPRHGELHCYAESGAPRWQLHRQGRPEIENIGDGELEVLLCVYLAGGYTTGIFADPPAPRADCIFCQAA